MCLYEGNTQLHVVHMYFYCCRETEWLFSSDPGRRQLAESAGFVVVTLHRGHAYSSLDAVKEEVAGKAVELVQQGLPHGKQVYILYAFDVQYIILCSAIVSVNYM